MTLTAPEHLRGRIGNHRPELLAERAEWIRQVRDAGQTTTAIGVALGISRGAAIRATKAAAGPRRIRATVNSLFAQGLIVGSAKRAIDAMPVSGRTKLADAAARTGKPMSSVLADFWAQHHGAQG